MAHAELMFKKQRKIAPYFPTHPPFNAVAGQYASLTGEQGVNPYCVLMQVAEDDTRDNYVICRGFDPRILVFVDYEAGNSNKPGIAVAKPYGHRKPGLYKVGELYPALLPTQGNATYTPPSPTEIGLRLGQNPGVVETDPAESGQPRDLAESLALLYDDNNVAINWLLLGVAPPRCDDLPAPGSYQAIAGGTIPPGVIGPIVYDGTVYQVKNHSRCEVLFGHEVGFHIDPDCNTFFVPCVCCDEVPGDCCDKAYSICINAQTHILRPLSSSPYSHDIATWILCCRTPDGMANGGDEPGSFYQLTGWIECDPVTEVIYFWWNISGAGIGTPGGRIELEGLCTNGTSVTYLNPESAWVPFTCQTFTSPSNNIVIHASDGLLECEDCNATPPPETDECCDKLLWFCLNGLAVQLAIDGGTHTWDVSDCCDCASATLEIRLRCDPETDRITLQWFYTCDGGFTEIGAISLTDICPATTTQLITVDASCFLQIQVTVADIGCDLCEVIVPEDPPISTACCDPVPATLSLTIVGGAYAGSYSMAHAGGEWVNTTGGFSCRLSCNGAPEWVVNFELDTYTTLFNTCNPLSLDFDVSATAYGITSLTIVE